jgi:hypothetical protein
MTDKSKWKFKLPDNLLKINNKVAEELNLNYAPTNINLNINLQVSPGEEDKVASIMLDALRPYASFLQQQSGSTSSAMIEQSSVTATLAIKGSASTELEPSS